MDAFKAGHPKISCVISYEPNHTTSKIEGNAVYTLNRMSDELPVTKLWKWSLDMHDDPDFVNFHNKFPALATAARRRG